MPGRPTVSEALRLRSEGLSLPSIAKKLGVDQRQIQRWLKAAGAQRPGRVAGLDGRTSHGRPVSAVEGGDGRGADGDDKTVAWELDGLCHDIQRLDALKRALTASHRVLLKAWRQKLPKAEALAMAEQARRSALAHCGLWDEKDQDGDAPDCRLELLLASLADRLTPAAQEVLHDDITDGRSQCPHCICGKK